MRAYQLPKGGAGVDALVEVERPQPKPAHRQVLVKVKACSLNFRDFAIARGTYRMGVRDNLIPLSDGAGEVAEIGAAVTRVKVGDHVAGNFFQRWPGGEPSAESHKSALGGGIDGMLAEYVVLEEDGVVKIPAHLSLEEGATLPCAAVTVWHAMMEHAKLKAGDTILLQGTGGVSIFGLLFAHAAGVRAIITSSSDEKLARLKALGADHGVDYTKTDWSRWAVETYGKPQRRSYDGGVDVVINFTGGDTWVPSLRCLKRGGKLLVCGATAGYDPKEDLRYVWSFELQIVGSNSFYDDDLAALMTLIAAGKIKPVIDKVLPLDEAREGLRLIQDREVIGKVVVTP